MTDNTDHITVSRRNVLAGLGAIGVASAGAGLGTTAYFSDSETFADNTLTAGQLELSITWQQLYYGAAQQRRPQDYGAVGRPFVNAYPDHDGNGLQSFDDDGDVRQYVDVNAYDDPEDAAKAGTNLAFSCDEIATFEAPSFAPNENALIELDDVKPGDCGEVTLGVKLCDNPGYIWLNGELVGESDGGHDESTGAELADEIIARAWYDLDGDNVYDEGEPQIVAGTLRDVLKELQSGQLLAFDPSDGAVEEPDDDVDVPIESGEDACIPLPKEDDDDDVGNLSPGDVFTYEVQDGDDIEIEITDVYYENGEPVGFDWESNVGVCQVRVRGGPPGAGDPPGEGPATVFAGCPTEGTVFAPENDGNPNRTYYQISNFRFYVCELEHDNGEENGGECFEPSHTRFIGFEWCLPISVGNHVQGDSVSFDLSFYTEQCRHNPDPANPFADPEPQPVDGDPQ